MLTSLELQTIRRSKNIKNARFVITEVSLKDLSKIIKEVSIEDLSNIIKKFNNVPYEGFVIKRSKHMPTDSYFYLLI